MRRLDPDRFEALVEKAYAELPIDITSMLENVVIQIDDDNADGLLGLYEGIPLTERYDYGDLQLPDVVTIYRLPLCEMASDLAELEHEVRVTLIHELAHHLGIDDDRLHQLGWA
jgi:predicted Zn-dependent protease with MMP-like domain